MTSFVKRQLIVLTALSLAAFLIIAFVYAKVPTLLGVGQIQVTAQAPAAGGIYPNANVTYRGVTVGKVKDVTLNGDTVDVVMWLDDSQVPPANSRAQIRSVSAIGEQYVDFEPQPGASAPLADDAVIPVSGTDVPTPTADVLQGTDTLLASVNQKDLSVVLDEFDKGFRGIGPDLGRIADNTQALVATADQNYPQTEGLIRQAEPFLDSQNASGPAARSWTANLASLTDQLRTNDQDLRSMFANGAAAGAQVKQLIGQLRPTTPTLLKGTKVLTDLAKAYNQPIEQLLVVYPAFASVYQSSISPRERGLINFNIKLNPNRPVCYNGWAEPGQPGGPRNAFDTADAPFPTDTFCRLPQKDDRVVRSSRNIPCFEPDAPEGRRAALIEQCRGNGFTTSAPLGAQIPVGGPLSDAPLTEGPGDGPDPLADLGSPPTSGGGPVAPKLSDLMLGTA